MMKNENTKLKVEVEKGMDLMSIYLKGEIQFFGNFPNISIKCFYF